MPNFSPNVTKWLMGGGGGVGCTLKRISVFDCYK